MNSTHPPSADKIWGPNKIEQLETAIRTSLDHIPTLDAALSFALNRSHEILGPYDLPPGVTRDHLSSILHNGFVRPDTSGPSPLSDPSREGHKETPCFLSLLLVTTLLRAAFDANWGEGGFSNPPSDSLSPLSGADWARLTLRMNDFCAGCFECRVLRFIPFAVHLSRVMGASLEAPEASSELHLWRVTACDRRYIAPTSRVADLRLIPCHLRALASSIAEYEIYSIAPAWAVTRSIRETCETLAEVTMVDPNEFDLRTTLLKPPSGLIRYMIATESKKDRSRKFRALSPGHESYHKRRD